ncbi:MAG: PEP-CTERM sorting domain-containing protein [Armatimonadetes bacterium]|nr:PEP-CTERM sorting domain-containing protein [Armatimonadota bacterium]
MRLKTLTLAAVAVIVPLASTSFAVTGLRPAAPDLTCTESIAAMGGGVYRYTYTLTNVSALAPVWWWGVYTNNAPGGLVYAPMGSGYFGSIPSDMALAGYSYMGWDTNFAYGGGGATSVGTGGSSTLVFDAVGYDAASKPFFADIDGEWTGAGTLGSNADGTQILSYMGDTSPVPEPASFAALAIGVVALARRRR